MRAIFTGLAAAFFIVAAPAANARAAVSVVAAENFYGELAREIGGDAVSVTSILSRPGDDPHLFETVPSTARAVADARIVVYNGAGYDGWMDKLLSATSHDPTTIVAARLAGAKDGDNPHLWYQPATLPAVATRLAALLAEAEPGQASVVRANLHRFDARFSAVKRHIARIRARFHGTVVTATEPVFGYMAEALGLKMVNAAFQTAVMNGTEPSARAVADFSDSLNSGRVKILFYNRQVSDPLAERMLAQARGHHVAVVGVTETMPAGMTIAGWLDGQLDEVETALEGAAN